MRKLLLAFLLVPSAYLTSDVVIAKPTEANRVCASVLAIGVPLYPPDAAAASVQGDVLVRMTIDDTGEVVTATVVSGEHALADSSRDAAAQWRFGKTTQANSIPKEVELVFRFVPTSGVVGLAIENKRLTVRVPVSLADPLLLDAGPVLAFLAEKRPQPPYPRNVERTNERAVVDVEVTTSGQVSWLRSDPGDRSFRALAEQAARGWTFRSLQLNGQPIRLKGQIAFNWIVA